MSTAPQHFIKHESPYQSPQTRPVPPQPQPPPPTAGAAAAIPPQPQPQLPKYVLWVELKGKLQSLEKCKKDHVFWLS